jgi:DNA-directed RNA polymerase subunit RPC12/RpoP
MTLYKCVIGERPADDSPEARSLRCQYCTLRLGLVEKASANPILSDGDRALLQAALAGCTPGPRFYEHVGVLVCGDPEAIGSAAAPFIDNRDDITADDNE